MTPGLQAAYIELNYSLFAIKAHGIILFLMFVASGSSILNL